jgi:hypothetical protein
LSGWVRRAYLLLPLSNGFHEKASFVKPTGQL